MDAFVSTASTKDVQELTKLVNSAYRGEQAKKGWTHEADLIRGELRTDEASVLELIEKPHSVILKFMEENRILGCVHLEKQDDKLYLGMLSVYPEIQARGIGKKLLAAAGEHARNTGARKIEMTVISARHELIAWYERNGFHKTSETKPFPGNEKFGIPRVPVEFIVMGKTVS